MRNLKRALSLAMASVMVLGLMVVGTGASYKDVAEDKNVEAIEVLQAVGVMVGDDNGNFNPDQNVTRNEMAVVMANLMDYRVASYSGTSPFTDVPSWAEPYVAACYTNGIVAGTSATTFGGDQSVTTAQAALMLMKALGYFQYQSDFEDDWQFATIKQANLIDLFIDVDSGVREAMTRNDVAQLVLNTLEAGTVIADDDTIKVEADGVTVEAGKVSYEYITSGEKYAAAIDDNLYTGSGAAGTSTQGYIVQLGEKLYLGDLKKDASIHDDFGAPANRWTYKNSEIGTYAEEADYVFAGVVKGNAMYNAVGKTAATSYTWNVYMDGTTSPLKPDGINVQPLFGRSDVSANNTSDLNGTVRGATTYVYLDSQNKEATVAIVNSYAAKITKVEDGTITLSDADLTFDIEGYDEDDVVLYTKSVDSHGDWTVQSILGVADRVEGVATTIRVDNRVVVDDTTYYYNYRFNDEGGDMLALESIDQTVAFYLDKQGNIVMIDDAVESNDFAYVYSIGMVNQYGDGTFGAKLIFTDGTSKNVILDTDNFDSIYADYAGTPGFPADVDHMDENDKLAALQDYFTGTAVGGTNINALVTYTANEDSTYSIDLYDSDMKVVTYGSAKPEIIKNGAARIEKADGTYLYADKNTAYLINDKTDDDDEFNAYVGYNNVPDVDANSSTELVAFVNSKNVVKAVVVLSSEVSGTNDVIFVVGNNNVADGKVQGTGSNKYYVYDAVVNGEVTSIAVKYNSDAFSAVSGLAKGQFGVFYGMTENSNGYVTKLTTSATDMALNNGSGIVWEGTKAVSSGGNLTFNTKYTPVSIASNDDAVIAYYDGSNLEIASRVKTDSDDKAYVVTDDGVIVGIFIVEVN